MNTYPLATTLTGVLTDDYLYYEGAERPQAFYLLWDKVSSVVKEKVTKDEILELESYFNDLYNLFLRKLTRFVGEGHKDDEEALKLQALLQELVKIKNLIENAGRVDIMVE